MPVIYVISGLGVDERVFKNISFAGYQPVFIKWISPLADEAIEAYAKRLSAQIKHQKPVIAGLSFGGIMAIEIAKIMEVEKIILLTSVKTKHELPFYYRLPGSLNIHKLIPTFLLKNPNIFSRWIFGAESQDWKLFAELMHDLDPVYMHWALDKIAKWQNEFTPPNLIHIHGGNDHIFPPHFLKPDILIPAAGHLMTVNRADQVNAVLRKVLLTEDKT